MHPILVHRIASAAVMPLVAAGGWAGYSYYQQQPYQDCVVITTNITTTTTTYQTQVANMQHFFVNRGYLRGNPNGRFDQPTRMALQRFQADNALPVTGTVDQETRTTIQQVSCGGAYYPTNPPVYPDGQLSLSAIDAPSRLQVGQNGIWTVRVDSNAYGGTLRYSVSWGDENQGMQSSGQYQNGSMNYSATFTHAYQRPGVYRPVFTVRDGYGHTAQASATVTIVGNTYSYSHTPSYCDTSAGWYDRACEGWNTTSPYQQDSYYNDNYYNNDHGTQGIAYGCTTFYDRSCYVNGQYVGPNFGSDATTYNGTRSGYSVDTGTYYGTDYSCYYDRACLARMNGGN